MPPPDTALSGSASRRAVPTRFERMHLVANPTSGTEPLPLNELKAHLMASGAAWQIHLTGEGRDARQLAQDALEAGADVVVACGGDGTVLSVAEAIIAWTGADVPLAIVPRGTANVLAAELGLPTDLDAAIALVTGPKQDVRTIDAGRVGERYFLLRLGIGLEAAMTVLASPEEKERLGRWAYFTSAFRAWRQLDPVTYRLTIDGAKQAVRGVSCVVCNSGNVGVRGMQIHPDIDVADGLLHTLVLQRTDVRALVTVGARTLRSLLPGIQKPQPQRSYALCCLPGREVTVLADPPQVAACDGEPLGKDEPFPLDVRVVPGAVRVVVPKPAEEDVP